MYSDSSYTYEEDYSYDLEYDPQFEEGADIFSLLDNDDSKQESQHQNQNNSPPPQVDPNDNSIAFSTSINQSKRFIYKNLGLSVSKLKSNNIHGLVVLRLQDFSLIRNDTRCQRKLPHLLILPRNPEEFSEIHTDFYNSLKHLYK